VCCDAACSDPQEQCNFSGRPGECVSTAASVPALSHPALLLGGFVLATVAALALVRRRSRES
jgi:hypothetical protein